MIHQSVQAFRNGEISVQELISNLQSLFDSREPEVLAFLPEPNRFARLQKEAEELVARYPDPKQRPTLFGMTVGVKDIFHVAGFTTQAGSRLPPEELQGSEAPSVTRLKNKGALVMGKTVTTEFAYFTPGLTRNPHNSAHTPGGSSSGSAAAVAAGFCSAALGTQTIGSIIRPAAFCGVVGFKPTYDRIPRDGVIPLSPSLDHVGFFTPDVDTAKRVASALLENWGIGELNSSRGDSKPVLGIPEGPYLESATNEGLTHFEDVCELLNTNYQIRRVRVMDDFQEIRDRHDAIMSHEAMQVHKEWFAKHETLYSPKFSDLIHRGQSITNYRLHLEARDAFRASITQTMNDNQIDIWICPPAIGPAPKGLDSTGDPVMCLPWTQIGFPAINIPTTKNEEDLPMGLQLVGKWNSDESLLAWAEDIEKVVRKI
ncbi:MAG: amidase [Chloroflexi bacterium]|nr:amidase [Chloroflexota bacterium]MDL1940844.1 amidase [Chloroflexi bacterium CFX2]